MVTPAVLILAAALISIALADEAQLNHAERIKLCEEASVFISDPDCANICPHPCDPGYVCQHGACVDRCLATKCKSGYQCLDGQCRKLMGCGQECDPPKWICAAGLSCINGKCTGRTVGENGTCGGSSCNKCELGTRCYQGKCREVMGCGESCDYPKWICGLGATCKHGRCQCPNYDLPGPCGNDRNDCKIP